MASTERARYVLLARCVMSLMILLAGLGAALAQGRRVALVVGNGNYQSASQLRNPSNDAQLMARTLIGLGFSLVGGGAYTNLDKTAFDQVVRAFGQSVRGADVALFYYSGHGVQVRGANWLVPTDANPSRMQDLDFQLVDAGLVLRQMEGAGTKLNVMVLDACRNNPFGGRGMRDLGNGLGVMRAPEGTVISYATQPGNTAADGVGPNSPYTKALEEMMRQPGLDVLNMFNRVGLLVKKSTAGEQQPWVSASPLDGAFYFAGLAPGVPIIPPSGPSVATVTPVPATPRTNTGAMPPSVVPSSNLMSLASIAAAKKASAAIAERIAAVAAPRGIPVLSAVNFVPPAADVPAEIARFSGAWGPGKWGNTEMIVLVESVDARGNACMMRMQSACTTPGCPQPQPVVRRCDAKVENGSLSFITGSPSEGGERRVNFQIRPDGGMRMTGTTILGFGVDSWMPRIQ